MDKDLQYRGAAYPMALECLRQVGCEDTTLYAQLLSECKNTCPQHDPRTKDTSICLATFNAAESQFSLNWILTFTSIISLLSYWLIMS